MDCGCDCACDCGTTTPVDACGNPIEVMPVQQIIGDGCGCGPVYFEGAVPGAIDGQILGPVPVIQQTPEGFFEGASSEEGDGEQEGEAEQAEEKSIVNEDSDHAPAPSFLKRMSSWIITPTDQIES